MCCSLMMDSKADLGILSQSVIVQILPPSGRQNDDPVYGWDEFPRKQILRSAQGDKSSLGICCCFPTLRSA